LVVAAAGNDNTDAVSYPAGYPVVLNVGATNSSDQKAGFSNFGATVSVAAPGEGIFSTFPGSYGYADGTSMSSPMVAGLASLVFSLARPGTTNEQVRALIEDNCLPMDTAFVQHGRIRADLTLQKVPRPIGTTVLLGSVIKHSGGSTAGNVVSARYADGAMYTLQSTPHASLGAINGAFLNFTLPASIAVNRVAEVNLTLRQRGALRVTNFLYAWNYQTGRFDLLKSFPMNNAMRVETLRFQAPSPYLSDTKRMRFLTRAVLPKRLQTAGQSGFTLGIDEAKLGLSLTN